MENNRSNQQPPPPPPGYPTAAAEQGQVGGKKGRRASTTSRGEKGFIEGWSRAQAAPHPQFSTSRACSCVADPGTGAAVVLPANWTAYWPCVCSLRFKPEASNLLLR